MPDSEIAERASFDGIRYAQLWEDADVLVSSLPPRSGATLVSICSAGDNALAMLTLDPRRVIAVDLSAAQVECMRIRMAAYRLLSHQELLELFGSRPSQQRGVLLARVAAALPADSQRFWAARSQDVVAFGLGGVGKFEAYFRLLRRYLLPLTHSRATRDALFVSRAREERERFLYERWNNRRWRLLMSLFFSRFAMGRLGRDPAFFDQVVGSVPEHVGRRVVHACVELDPAVNPYLHWIMRGDHGEALPLSLRPEHFETIRSRLDRVELRHGALETFLASGEPADGFNLSDIFEYMTPGAFEAVYRAIVAAAAPGARLVYWNMMVPRRVPTALASRTRRLKDIEDRGKAADKAFFYSDFVVEEVR